MATTAGAQSGVTLNDAALFRQACYVNGAWVQARSGATIDVDNPATGPGDTGDNAPPKVTWLPPTSGGSNGEAIDRRIRHSKHSNVGRTGRPGD